MTTTLVTLSPETKMTFSVINPPSKGYLDVRLIGVIIGYVIAQNPYDTDIGTPIYEEDLYEQDNAWLIFTKIHITPKERKAYGYIEELSSAKKVFDIDKGIVKALNRVNLRTWRPLGGRGRRVKIYFGGQT